MDRMGRIVAVTGAHAVIMLDAQDAVFADAQRSPDIGTLCIEEPEVVFLSLPPSSPSLLLPSLRPYLRHRR